MTYLRKNLGNMAGLSPFLRSVTTKYFSFYLYIQIKTLYLCAMSTVNSKFSQCLYFTSNALARKTEKLAQESWSRVGLSPSHGYLLLLVLEEPGMQAGMLARQLQLQPSTITRLIEKLENMKLVHRVTEGKTTSVFPSNKAKTLLPKMLESVTDFTQRYTAILGMQESTALVNGMAQIADKLEP